MRSYLLTFDTGQVSRDRWIETIDGLPQIVNWHAFFEGAVVLVSNESAKELGNLIRDRLPRARFVVSELQRGRKDGWLPKSVWDIINHPTSVDAV